MKDYKHFRKVPLERAANLEFRDTINEAARQSSEAQALLLEICKNDPLFFFSTFCWLFEPRAQDEENRIIPFIPWAHQIPIIGELDESLGLEDVHVPKSRGEGLSWICIALFFHRWLFQGYFSGGLVSRNEEAVDRPNDPDSLMWKVDFLLQKLPVWMVPVFHRSTSNHTLLNVNNQSIIAGYAATGDVQSGGRKTVILMDEFAKFPRENDYHALNSTQHVTESRFFISTPKGPEGAFYDICTSDSSAKEIKVHWSQNPTRTIGMYRVHYLENGRRRVELIDEDYWQQRAWDKSTTAKPLKELELEITDNTADNPFKYEFMVRGPYTKNNAFRSLWYDHQCRRAGATPKGVSQELDLDFGGSSSRFFSIEVLEEKEKSHCKDPFQKIDLHFEDPAHPRVVLNDSGQVHLWATLNRNRLPNRPYSIGCDISAGTAGVASSNSSACILDCKTGEQVGVFTVPDMRPSEFADYVMAIGYWLEDANGPARIIWETNGSVGAEFTNRVVDAQYPNLYQREVLEQRSKKKTKKLGWRSGTDSKAALLGEWARAIATSECTVRDANCIDEAKYYMLDQGGKIIHVGSKTDDPSGASERHGDRVIAHALSWWDARSVANAHMSGVNAAREAQHDHTFAERREAYYDELARAEKQLKRWSAKRNGGWSASR